MNNLEPIIHQLQQERDQIDRAINVLSSIDIETTNGTRERSRKFSAAARRRMSLAQKARWRAIRKTKD